MLKLAPSHAIEVNTGIGLNKYCNIKVFYKSCAIKDEKILNSVAKWMVAPVFFKQPGSKMTPRESFLLSRPGGRCIAPHQTS